MISGDSKLKTGNRGKIDELNAHRYRGSEKINGDNEKPDTVNAKHSGLYEKSVTVSEMIDAINENINTIYGMKTGLSEKHNKLSEKPDAISKLIIAFSEKVTVIIEIRYNDSELNTAENEKHTELNAKSIQSGIYENKLQISEFNSKDARLTLKNFCFTLYAVSKTLQNLRLATINKLQF